MTVGLDAIDGAERACVADLLAAIDRAPGRPAAVRRSPGAAAVAGTPGAPYLCHLPID